MREEQCMYKKICRRALAFALVLSVFWSSIQTFQVKAGESEETNPAFKVIGASVRFVNENTEVDGIRFAVGIREDIFATLTDEEKAAYRLLVMPSKLVDGRLEEDEVYSYQVGAVVKTSVPLDVQINWEAPTTKDGYKVTHVVLTDIDKSYYHTDITARMYHRDSAGTITYSEQLERSYLFVADAALNDVTAYTSAKHNALLGVKFEKTGTWDFNGEQLTTNGSETTSENTKIHPKVIDRVEKIHSSQFVIDASFYVGVRDEDAFVSTIGSKDKSLKGLLFGYDKTTKGYYILDYRYGGSGEKAGWYPYLRVDKGINGGWSPVVLESKTPLASGWYDFRVSVDQSGEYAEVLVEYKTIDENHYTTLMSSYGNENWCNANMQLTGNDVGFMTTIENYTVAFDPNIKVSNGTVHTRGQQSQKIISELNEDGTGNVTGSFITDYRTSGAGSKVEGITLGGPSADYGYLFGVSGEPSENAFHIAVRDAKSREILGTADLVSYNKLTEAGLSLVDKDEILVDYRIKITLEGNVRVFDISYRLSHKDTTIYERTDWKVQDTANTYIGNKVYLVSEDNGEETSTGTGDGKTIFYPISVTFNTEIEKSTADLTIEDINVFLNTGERYTNPIPDANQPYRDRSVEAQVLAGKTEASAVKNQSLAGDPYILRYNNKFYLYVSNNSWYCTYRVWESLDLLHYTYLGEYDLLDANGNRTENDDATNQGYDLECPWAPEVHYWNGEFYMYTSPHAKGNLVLKSTTGLPYGDYQVVNEKINSQIDGSFFIDDNEDKWFVYPDGPTVSTGATEKAYNMPKVLKMTNMYTPTSTKETLSKAGITGDWVEGPFLFKRDGIYYFIGTGETVGQPAYRLNYAYNDSGSVAGAANWSTEMEPNLILNTEGDYNSYGHGAVTVGPNLDSYWFTYHMNRVTNGAYRTVAINRVEFSGTRMSVIGQDKETAAPEAPDFYTSYFTALSNVKSNGKDTGITRTAGYRSYNDARTNAGEGLYEKNGQLISGRLQADGTTVEEIRTGSRFTAEYSFKNVATNGTFKCLFGGGYVTINNGKTVELYIGNEKKASAPMLVNGEEWNWSAYHNIIVTYETGRITVAIDGCTKIDIAATRLGNGVVGYAGVTDKQNQIGGLVFSNQAFGSSDQDAAKTIDGSFYASNYYEAKDGERASSLSANSSIYKVTVADGEDEVTYTDITSKYNSHTYHIYKDATALKLAEGDRVVYKIDVPESGTYTFESLFSRDSDGSIIKVQIDNNTPTCYQIRKNNYSMQQYDVDYYESLQFEKRLIDNLYLEKGLHTITIKVVEGTYTSIEYEMNRVRTESPKYYDDLGVLGGAVYYSDYVRETGTRISEDGEEETYRYWTTKKNTWEIADGAYHSKEGTTNLARFGLYNATDYKVRVDIKTDAVISDEGYNAGILLRLTEPSLGDRLSYGSGKGYYVCLEKGGVRIYRFDYNELLVAKYDVALKSDLYYNLEAECFDNSIVVYLNGQKILTYLDPYGFACGAAALYSNMINTYYKNLEIGKDLEQADSPYVTDQDKRYEVISGAFWKLEKGFRAELSDNLMLDREVNAPSKDLYAVRTGFMVVPDKAATIKGIVFNYDAKDGSYMVLDYRYAGNVYQLYVRHFDGTSWDTDVWCTNVTVQENTWYDFEINVDNSNTQTAIEVRYKTTQENEYTSISHTFAYAMNGRQVGYISSVANGMEFGVATEIEPKKLGLLWSDEWSDILSGK